MRIKSEFQRNFIKLFKGTVIGQLIPIATTPIITRLYTPSEIGKFSLYFSIISIVASVISLKMDQVIVLPKNNPEALRLFNIAVKISKYTSIICVIILVVGKVGVALNMLADFPLWWFLLGFHFYYLGLSQTYTFLLNRYKQYIKIANSKIINGVTYPLVQILLFHLHELGLVIGFFIGAVASSIYVRKSSNVSLTHRSLGSIKFTPFERRLISKYKNFPLYTSSNALVNSLSNNLPLLMLGNLYSYTTTGFYSWANRIIQTPMSFIISTMSQVFYQEIASKVSQGKSIYNLVKKTYKRLFLVGIIPYTLAFIFSPTIFSFVFGKAWMEAGLYTRYLIPWLFIVFMNSPITSIILVLNKQREYFIYEFVLLLLRASVLLIGYFVWHNPTYSVALYGFVGFAYNIFLSLYLLRISHQSNFLCVI